jgi:hypothetical protein
MPQPAPQNVFVTRLHLSYDGERFPEDLRFQQTGDRTNFQGRYVLRHAFRGAADCPAGQDYRRQLRDRREKEAVTLAGLTGWELAEIRDRMRLPGEQGPTPAAAEEPWWKRLWPGR